MNPSLHLFLTSFVLSFIRNESKKERNNLSVKAKRLRKYIRDNEISDEVLEQIWKEFQKRKYRPFSSLALLELVVHDDGSRADYTINTNEENKTEAYLDIIEAIVKGHKAKSKG